MKYLLLAIFSFSALSINSQGISFFDGKWHEALEEAQKNDKIVFVDAFAKWCGPCKKMAKNVFTQAKVGEFFNANFVNLKLDMEESDGRTFGAKYPVSAYPTLFFLDSEGNILKKVVGGKQADDLIAIAKAAIKSYDKSDQFAERYEAGERDVELMTLYVKELNKVGKPSLKISNEYLNSNPDISNSDKAKFLMAAVLEADSKLFDALIEVKKEAIAQSSEAEFEELVKLAAFKTVSKAVDFDYKDLVDEAVTQYKASGCAQSARFELEANMLYNSLSGFYDEWYELSKKYTKKYGKKDPSVYKKQLTILEQAFAYVPRADDYADVLIKDLLKKEANVENYSYYIRRLMNTHRNEEALKVTKEAIKKVKSNGEDTKELERMLDYLNKIIK